MGVKNHLDSLIAGTLFVTLAALCPAASPAIVGRIAQPHAIESSASDRKFKGDIHCSLGRIGGCAVAIPCYLHSLTPQGLPIERASQHVSPGFAVDEDWLRLIPISVNFMAFNFIGGVQLSTLAIAAGTLLGGCGGGNPTDSESVVATSPNSTSSSISADPTTSTMQIDPTTQGAASATLADATVVASAETVKGTSNSTSAPAAPGTTSNGGVIGTRSAVAINLTGIAYYSPELPTIDVMKRAGGWLTQCSGNCTGLATGASSWDTKEQSALDLDANGWVKSLPAISDTVHKYRVVSTMLSANGVLPLGRYVVRYDGVGTITYSGFTKNSASSFGRDVLDLTSTGNVWLTVSATSPSNYIRNIRVYMPGGACANDLTVYAASAGACNSTSGAYVPFESFPTTQIWHPQFLQDIKGFRALRFMDWSMTNATKAATWADRTAPDARIWTAATGVPIEAMLDLAKLVGTDAWLNVPPYANDDYAAHMGSLAATHLAPGVSKMYLEYGNEPWNYGFPMAGWMVEKAKAKWPLQVSQGVSAYTLADSWYGERLAQVCQAAKAASTLVRCVVNSQASNPWITGQMLACPYAAAELGHQCAKDVDVVAIAPYFGAYIANTKLRSVVATWYADADGGLSKLFQEITGTDRNGVAVSNALLSAAGSGAPTGALAISKSWMVGTKAVVDAYGLPMWAYEGGQHLLLPGGDSDQKLQSLFVAANRDPRMGAAYDRMMADWKAAGGQTFAYYSHVAPASVYGFWGLKESMSDNASPKWTSALKNRNDKTCNWTGC